jgi:hypothetical protein
MRLSCQFGKSASVLPSLARQSSRSVSSKSELRRFCGRTGCVNATKLNRAAISRDKAGVHGQLVAANQPLDFLANIFRF